jgi:MFS family permease
VDSFGERIILASGIGIVAVSTGLAGLSQSYTQLLVLRGLGGIGSAMFTVSATALLLRVVDAGNRGRASGLFQAGFLLGGLLGPLLGGFLTEVSLRLPFYVYAVSLIAAGSIGFVFLRSADDRPRATAPDYPESAEQTATAEDEPESTSLTEAWGNPAYRGAVMVNLANGWAFFGVRISLVPLFVTEEMGLRPLWIGLGFLCASVAQAGFLLSAGKFVDRRGRRPAMIAGSLLAAVAFAALAIDESRVTFLLAMTATGVGAAFVGTAPGAVVGDIMHGRGGRVVAVFQMASDAGAIFGPLAAGLLADQLSFSAAFASCSVILLVALVLSVRMPETLPGAVRGEQLQARRRLPSRKRAPGG